MSHIYSTTTEEWSQYLLNAIRDALGRATGLEGHDLSLLVYYALGTHFLPHLQRFPPLVLYGPPGTGKSTIMSALTAICRHPKQISCGNITKAALRDDLALVREGTAFLEEADEWAHGRAIEQLLIQRSSRQTSRLSRKESIPSPEGHTWVQKHDDIFGTTVLHRRVPFRDPALTSRCLLLRTRRRPQGESRGVEPMPDNLIVETDLYGLLKPDVDGVAQCLYGPPVEARIVDTWAPVVAVAACVWDTDFVEWADGEMTRASKSLQDGQTFEPHTLVLRALAELCTKEGSDGKPVLSIRQSVKVTALVEKVEKDYKRRLTPPQACTMLREMEFPVYLSGGASRVKVDEESLRRGYRIQGLEDDEVFRDVV